MRQPRVEQGTRGAGRGLQEGGSNLPPPYVTEEVVYRDKYTTFYDPINTPQAGRGGTRQEVAEAGGGAVYARMTTAAPPATATSMTGKRPIGVNAAIQKEVDEGGQRG